MCLDTLENTVKKKLLNAWMKVKMLAVEMAIASHLKDANAIKDSKVTTATSKKLMSAVTLEMDTARMEENAIYTKDVNAQPDFMVNAVKMRQPPALAIPIPAAVSANVTK